MRYRMLGNTGMQVSVVGCGGIPIQRADVAAACTLLCEMERQGVNFIDTARGYTVSEAYLGEALEQTGLRAGFYLATKSMVRTREGMAAEIQTSLAALRTDYIDLYQLHNIKTKEDFALAFSAQGAVAALREAVQAGTVRHIGATAHSADSFAELLRHPEIETIMFPYNIVENQGEALMEQAARQGVGVIAMKPLAGGNIENGTLAIRYILQNPNCTLAIPGMAAVEELQNNIASADDTAPLTAAELAEIAQVRARLSGNFCRRCGYCAPCTVGIDIPSLFILQGYLDKYSLANWARARYAAAPQKASACVQCGACETRCPYDLPIREKLRQVAQAFEA